MKTVGNAGQNSALSHLGRCGKHAKSEFALDLWVPCCCSA